MQWCSAQSLQNQYAIDSNSLQRGCDQAKSEIISNFSTRYDLTAELAKNGNVPASAISLIAGGLVTGINVLVPGINYTSNPVINLIGGGGSGAAVTPNVVNQALASLNITAPGTNYTSAPSVQIVGGQPADTRSILLVKTLSLLSIRNVLGNIQNLSDKMSGDFKWADHTVKDIRAGQMNLFFMVLSWRCDR